MTKNDIVQRIQGIYRIYDHRGNYKVTFKKWGKNYDIFFNSPVTFDALKSAQYDLYAHGKVSPFDFHHVKWLFASITPYK